MKISAQFIYLYGEWYYGLSLGSQAESELSFISLSRAGILGPQYELSWNFRLSLYICVVGGAMDWVELSLSRVYESESSQNSQLGPWVWAEIFGPNSVHGQPTDTDNIHQNKVLILYYYA